MGKPRVQLSEEQRYFIKFLHLTNGLSPEQIRNHRDLKKPDGSLYQLKVIKLWCDRAANGEPMKVKKRTGRTPCLDESSRKEITDFIERNSGLNYNKVKLLKDLPCSRRTLNRYALVEGIRKFWFSKFETLKNSFWPFKNFESFKL